MRRLPPALHPRSASEKLVWLHIHANPGEHSTRSLAADLGGSQRTWASALSGLLEAGLIVMEDAPAGARPGEYRAVREAGESADVADVDEEE